MKSFPAFLSLDGRRVVISGGGPEALRKGRLFAAAGARIDVIAEAIDQAAFRADLPDAALHLRSVRREDFEGAAVAVVADAEGPEAARIAQAARAAGALVNVVDRPELCDFTTPAIIDRGEIVIAIGSNGAAPVLIQKIRGEIEALLPARLGALAAFARSFRAAVASSVPKASRRRFWSEVFNGPIAARVLTGDETGAREAMIASVNRPASAGAAGGAGVIHIVGAGPGDPELLTLRAHRLIQSADVIFHDRLVSDGVLALARRDAERVYVGKAKADHAVAQRDIEAQMIARAKAGAVVVRLKGGDPFVFGRGGEELEAARAAGVDVHVTPGITAAVGCAAAVGAPLTHRGYAQAVTFVTGHAESDGEPDIDWSALARLGHTIVVYMGVTTADAIASRLIAGGLAPATPVAVIENGTRADQRVFQGELAGLGALVAGAQVSGPAILVIGDVAALAAAGAVNAASYRRQRLSA